MVTETHRKHLIAVNPRRHSALEEFRRDERRPAVLLLSGLVLSALFFAIGILVGHITSASDERGNLGRATVGSSRENPPAASAPASAPAPLGRTSQATARPGESLTPAATQAASDAAARRYALLLASYSRPADARRLITRLEADHYSDIRLSTKHALTQGRKYSVLVGRLTRDEAQALAARLRATGDGTLRDAQVVEDAE